MINLPQALERVQKMTLQQVLETAKSLGFNAKQYDDSNEYGHCEYVTIKGDGACLRIDRKIDICEIHGVSVHYEANVQSYYDVPECEWLESTEEVKGWLQANSHFLELEYKEPDLAIFF